MNKELFNPKTVSRLCAKIKVTSQQKAAARGWLYLLEQGKLKEEKLNYFKFGEIILHELLGYDIKEMSFEEGNIEFSFKNRVDKRVLGIEAKGTKNKDLFAEQKGYKDTQKTPIGQLWNYMGTLDLDYGIATNYKDFVLIDRTKGISLYHFFDFEDIKNNDEKLKEFVAIFSKEQILDNNFVIKLEEESAVEERNFTKEFYKLFHETRLMLIKEFEDSGNTKEKSIHYSQLFLNRLMFVFFAEDSDKLEKRVFEDLVISCLKSEMLVSDHSKLISDTILSLFARLDKGSLTPRKIFGFNGGLFREEIPSNVYFKDLRNKNFFKEIYIHSAIKKEPELDAISKSIFNKYQDKLNPIIKNFLILASFDFNTEISVNILGHIFEQSLTDLEELKEETTTKRQKEGIFYTPEYITEYICRNTIIPYLSKKGVKTARELVLEHSKNINELEIKFKNLKILDPACGSGAFLVKAIDVLLDIHREIQLFKEDEGEYTAVLSGRKRKKDEGQLTLTKWHEEEEARIIIENNIFGVDLNEESVEITKLSLFLKIAMKNKKLIDLSRNIKCGNSLIASDKIDLKAFNWEESFADILKKDKFDIVIGNPPYVRSRNFSKEEVAYINTNYTLTNSGFDLATLFIEKSLALTHNHSRIGFIVSNKFFSARYGKKIREHCLSNTLFRSIINFGSGVFSDTPIETAILLMDKNNKNTEISYQNYRKPKIHIEIEPSRIMSIHDFDVLPDKIIYFSRDKIDEKIIKKLLRMSTRIGDFFDFFAGAGITGLEKDLHKEKFHESVPVYTGKSIWRYHTIDNEYFVKKGVIKTYSTKNICLVRELSTTNRAVIIDTHPEISLLNSVTIVTPKSTDIDIRIFTGIFNSKFFEKMYSLFYESTRTHANLRFKEMYVSSIPMPDINTINKKEIVEKVQHLTQLNKTFHHEKDKGIRRIEQNLHIEVKSKKIEEFYLYDFTIFCNELKKCDITLSIKQQDEWEEYFNDQKKILINLKEHIDKIDNDIDKIVCKFYGFNPEEIGRVE